MKRDNTPRSAIHGTAQKTFDYGQAYENTRDGWDKDRYSAKNKEDGHHYDFSRKSLNFVVTEDGIKPLSSTNSKQLLGKYMARLKDLGFKAYDPKAANQPISYIDWVISGDHDVMNKLAFGNQKVSFDLSDDNSHIKRMQGIEKWAVDVYKFACRKFGKENVIGVEVHLDETTPHAHVNVIPVAMRQERGRATCIYANSDGTRITSAEYRNLSKEKRKAFTKVEEVERKTKQVVSFSGLVGEDRKERSLWLRNFHTAFYKEVGCCYGLARGRARNTLTEEGKNRVRHKTATELEKETLQRIEELERICNKRSDELVHNENKLEEIGKKIARKQQVEKDLENGINDLKKLHQEWSKDCEGDMRKEATLVHAGIHKAFYKQLTETFKPVLDTLDRDQRETLHDSGYYDLADKANDVIGTALLLAINFVNEATTYAESHGGGGGGSMSGWGRKRDEDDNQWWLRCIRQAADMMKPGNRRGRRR